MIVRLVVLKGQRRTRVLQFEGPQIILGRGRGNTVRIPSAEVSRRHCRLRVQDGQVMVEDLGSVNGTFLNGDEVTGPWLVYPGDRLQVGPVTFVVEYDSTPGVAPAQAVASSKDLESGPSSDPVRLEDEAARQAAAEPADLLEALEGDEEPGRPLDDDELREYLAQLDEGDDEME